MVSFPAPSADDPEALEPGSPSIGRTQPDIHELASRLEAQGIQSTELVLDLVLHDLADEARQAVAATGAAVALEREGELVCRAAAGATAPDLGVRIHTESGLSGICVKQGSTQICRDTECDDRVDAEACRRLGVRSIVVVPLFSAGRIIGIFEVFSARPHAFTAEHMKKLESLAASAAQTVQAARQKSAPAAEMTASTLPEIASETPAGLSVDSIMQKVSPIDPAVRVLRWMVIGLAVPLLVLIGFDWGWNRVPSAPRVPHTTHVEQVPDSEPQPQGPQAVAGAASLAAAAQPKAPAPKTNRDGISSRGGLVVSQNGKVIYREVPSSPDGGTASRSGQSSSKTAGTTEAVPRVQEQGGVAAGNSAISRPLGVTGGRLLKSVQPQYPAEALLEKRQGTVILHGMVRQDGTMQDVKVVRGDPLLGEAALEAVRQWKYEPYRRNGQPVDMPIDITIDFNLPK